MWCVVSAKSGGAVAHTEQETDVDVGRHEDRNSAQLQDGRRSLGRGNPGNFKHCSFFSLHFYDDSYAPHNAVRCTLHNE